MWQRLLPLSGHVEGLALAQVVAFEGATDYVDLVVFLGNAEVNAVVHHFTNRFELLGRDVELNDLGAGHIRGPIEAFRLVTAHDEHVLFVHDHDFALADFAVEHFERGPLQRLEVIERVLVQLGEVKQFLRKTVLLAFPALKLLFQPLVLLRHLIKFLSQVTNAVM